jgi:hypothetical protein
MEITTATKRIVRRVQSLHFTYASKSVEEMVLSDEALGVVRDENELRVQPFDQIEQGELRFPPLVESGPVPIRWNAGHAADFDWALVVDQHVQHEIVRAVGVLVVRRVEICEVDFWQVVDECVGILLVHLELALKP